MLSVWHETDRKIEFSSNVNFKHKNQQRKKFILNEGEKSLTNRYSTSKQHQRSGQRKRITKQINTHFQVLFRHIHNFDVLIYFQATYNIFLFRSYSTNLFFSGQSCFVDFSSVCKNTPNVLRKMIWIRYVWVSMCLFLRFSCKSETAKFHANTKKKHTHTSFFSLTWLVLKRKHTHSQRERWTRNNKWRERSTKVENEKQIKMKKISRK